MFRSRDHGWVEVICGPMFSGKSEELIRRAVRVRIARRPVQVFKPALDDRYSDDEVVSHSALSIDAIPVDGSAELLAAVEDDTQVVGVDEAQFFDEGLVGVVEALADSGRQVIIAGLDLDYLGRPFEPVPTLVGRAEYVTKALAVCVRCGEPANFTQRTIATDDLVVLGATDSYEARCRRCWDPGEPEQPDLGL
jgi:thymidine kinase